MAGVTLLPIFAAFLISTYISRLTLAPLPYPAWQGAVAINESYAPEPANTEAIFAPNERLLVAKKAFKGRINGTESVAIAEDGSLYLPDRYGSILHATLDGPDLVPQLHSAPAAFLGGGRPLGADFDATGNLIVCLPPVGLVSIEAGTNRVVLLTTKVDGGDPQKDRTARISYANDLAIDEETGDIYFTDSANFGPALGAEAYYDTMWAYLLINFQGRPTGRVLKYSPSARTTTVVADNLWYPNGIALSSDRSFLVVAETPSKRLRRIDLSGAQAGQVSTFIAGLPGYPDGVSAIPGTGTGCGGFWVALVAPSQPAWLEKYVVPYKSVRALAANIFNLWRPKLSASGQVVKVSEAGVALDYLQDPTGQHISTVSSAVQVGDRLYLGNIAGDYISYLPVGTCDAATTA
mmetsp:Transcript_20727/g.62454  ORF Transcript_20727/g.62454 Transcript_20727/m.62454 type:complete len:407 (-) Transcript_20727:639-1859(-)|eukprot:CAMPEP_0206139792 /NCGR_PEP_ID=MMETSP1473-20131121/7269_1 /ASSEMBLY_ACC=CAM_ASM_001109 /TAXON_ID=1461547 /ORGANISM="Stichococcus sp, Strain RCC1054" /LENGTH=406 /DNA_ID=CAMNT_0053533699 /DNA_START=403 /DNA_END=1623 /DNA_ORIENTATION=+